MSNPTHAASQEELRRIEERIIELHGAASLPAEILLLLLLRLADNVSVVLVGEMWLRLTPAVMAPGTRLAADLEHVSRFHVEQLLEEGLQSPLSHGDLLRLLASPRPWVRQAAIRWAGQVAAPEAHANPEDL